MDWLELLVRWMISGLLANVIVLLMGIVFIMGRFINWSSPADIMLTANRLKEETHKMNTERGVVTKKKKLLNKIKTIIQYIIWPWGVMELAKSTVQVYYMLEKRLK